MYSIRPDTMSQHVDVLFFMAKMVPMAYSEVSLLASKKNKTLPSEVSIRRRTGRQAIPSSWPPSCFALWRYGPFTSLLIVFKWSQHHLNDHPNNQIRSNRKKTSKRLSKASKSAEKSKTVVSKRARRRFGACETPSPG